MTHPEYIILLLLQHSYKLGVILACMVHIEDYIFVQDNVNYTLINNKL